MPLRAHSISSFLAKLHRIVLQTEAEPGHDAKPLVSTVQTVHKKCNNILNMLLFMS